MKETVHLKIKRQADPESKSYWEEFVIPRTPNMNVVSALMAIQKNPINKEGKKVAPVVWESNCLEEVCGACSMRINGKARQSCSALIDQLKEPIVLEPLSKFKLVRDLLVDRTALFNALKKVKAWIDVDGTFDLGAGPRQTAKRQELAYDLSRCMSCGVCAEACPNKNSRTNFIGPAAIAQAHRVNLHPTGAADKEERVLRLMDTGGLQECGNSQNCVRACPKSIPLTRSIAEMKKEATKQVLKSIFKTPEK